MNQIDLKTPVSVEYRIEEAYKALRTNLQFCGANIRAICLTSCMPNEGKSTVSMRLAMALADSGKKTLYLDADMRKSVVIAKVDTHGRELMGLSHYLSGQAKMEDVICSTNVPRFYTITSGSFPPNPAELLGSDRFSELLTVLRRVFDYVIVDTPPLGNVIDGAIIAKNCDGAILVIESGAISYRFAQDVLQQLKRSNCPVLGAVLNKVEYQGGGRYYGRYGRYYGHYYGRYYGRYYGHYGEYGGYGGYGNYGAYGNYGKEGKSGKEKK